MVKYCKIFPPGKTHLQSIYLRLVNLFQPSNPPSIKKLKIDGIIQNQTSKDFEKTPCITKIFRAIVFTRPVILTNTFCKDMR